MTYLLIGLLLLSGSTPIRHAINTTNSRSVAGLTFTGHMNESREHMNESRAVQPPPVESFSIGERITPNPSVGRNDNLRLTCMPTPTEITLPKAVMHWTCAVYNYGSEPRQVSEATVVGALLQAGVRAIRAEDVNLYASERVRLGKWKTVSRIIKGLAIPAVPFVLSIATKTIIVTETEAKWASVAALVLPWLADATDRRVMVQPIIKEGSSDVAPGEFVIRDAYSGTWIGVTPVEAVLP